MPNQNKKILFITNGRGEDAVAENIIGQLPKTSIEVLPLVGKGDTFKNLGVKILGAQKNMPGGGFSFRNISWLLKDIPAGIMQASLSNLKALNQKKKEYALVICIGDIVPVIGALITKCPFIFVGVNKSDYYRWFGYNYTPWEKWIIKKWGKKTFTRDNITAQKLKKQGIDSVYLGNPLMDCLDTSKLTSRQANTIGFLPGTRDDACLNLEDFKKIACQIEAIAPSQQFKYFIASELASIPAPFIQKSFEETISSSQVVIGLSGTGNEQTAGFGTPLISFAGQGSQYNKKFSRAQKQLLGKSLLLVEPNPKMVAIQTLALLNNEEHKKNMGQEGKRRMGRSGATKQIAKYILEFLQA